MRESGSSAWEGLCDPKSGCGTLCCSYNGSACSHLRITNGYGPTENTTFATCHDVTDFSGQAIPIGKPIANSRIYILDPRGRLLPIGSAGELHTGGDGLAIGYVGIANLLGHLNVFSYAYSEDYSERAPERSSFRRTLYFGITFQLNAGRER